MLCTPFFGGAAKVIKKLTRIVDNYANKKSVLFHHI